MGKEFKMDMSQESERGTKMLLPEGWRVFKITACEEQVSKQGNEMFKFNFLDVALQETVEVFAIAVPKKRWFLKSILKACNILASEDGVYEWDIDDVLDMSVKGNVVHEEEEWIDRQGKTRQTKKHRIVEIDSVVQKEVTQATEETDLEKELGDDEIPF